jgi:hypothetical protein
MMEQNDISSNEKQRGSTKAPKFLVVIYITIAIWALFYTSIAKAAIFKCIIR